ncbi:MAG: glycosyltransferase, partial [Pirellulales bacterium]|nr:glycosyltransferase [Pirellulales bacterium]
MSLPAEKTNVPEHMIRPEQTSTTRVLVVSSTFPSSIQPIHGVFVKERMRNVASLPKYQLSVVAPTPYFPPLKAFPRWYTFSQLPRTEAVDGLQVFRPRYVLPPKVGGFFHPQLMAAAVRRGAAYYGGIEQQDLIDAHFIYPDGAAAAYLSRQSGKPLVITCRGEDILTIPDLPMCRKPVCFALQQATKLVALSDEIRSRMLELGADESKVELIPNGVATDKFRPIDQAEARRACDLPLDRKVIVSVGYRLERKGFHLLIEAASHLLGDHPNLLVVIVGGPARWGQDYSDKIMETVQRCQMQDHVVLAGPQSQSDLAKWYSAADLFALMTSREGSPNVLMEALACGTPA